MKKKQFINVALATLLACPMNIVAGTPGFGPDDEVPIVVHGPHRGPQNKPVAVAAYNEDAGMVDITFCKTLADVSVSICKNGVGVMNCHLGDATAGSEYVIPLDNDMDTTGMVIYIVSEGEVFSVINLN